MQFSVLMSVYKGEKPDFLRESLISVFEQTLKPDEVVLVEDGPLTDELYAVIKFFELVHSSLKTVMIPVNGGLGRALQEGLKHCVYELVARMDTDDIAKPERFARQVGYMTLHPECDIVGSWVEEFMDSPQEVLSTRRVPESHDEIVIYARGRNPMNHPSVMFRRQAVLSVGGYEHFPLFEDYFLWVRMIIAGCRFHNLQESLMWFRLSPDTYKRRGGWKYACDEAKFQSMMYRMGLISLGCTCKNVVMRFGVRILPNSMREQIYKRLLRG